MSEGKMGNQHAVTVDRVLVVAALALVGFGACRKPAPPPEPPPIESRPTAGGSIAPADPGTSGGSSDAPP
jgi:hypothetical protein